MSSMENIILALIFFGVGAFDTTKAVDADPGSFTQGMWVFAAIVIIVTGLIQTDEALNR